MRATPYRPDLPAPIRAVLLRELRSALGNRYFQVFAVFALGAGAGAVYLGESEEAPTFFLVQVTLYLVSLFALLVGVSAAQAEREEWPLLFAQPVGRSALVWGKFGTGCGVFAAVLGLLFGPAVFYGQGALGALLGLYGAALGIAAVFLSLGLWVGFRMSDRVQALVLGVGLWLAALFGLDLFALVAAHWPAVQRAPDAWVALLMANPPDAFRIHALFSTGQIPPETADKSALAAWWLARTGVWFAALAAAWSLALLCGAGRRLERTEC